MVHDTNYSYRRSERWQLVIFLNCVALPCVNAYILWKILNILVKENQNNKRRKFFLEFGKALVLSFIENIDNTTLHKLILWASEAVPKQAINVETTSSGIPSTDVKANGCIICPRSKDRKILSKCS